MTQEAAAEIAVPTRRERSDPLGIAYLATIGIVMLAWIAGLGWAAIAFFGWLVSGGAGRSSLIPGQLTASAKRKEAGSWPASSLQLSPGVLSNTRGDRPAHTGRSDNGSSSCPGPDSSRGAKQPSRRRSRRWHRRSRRLRPHPRRCPRSGRPAHRRQ